MHPRARRLLSWGFILIFLLITPAIILTTAGYRYNFSKHRVERTGVMLVDSRPTGATITLNGETRSSQTPARLPSLSPGTYDVSVEKIGYHAWEKNVTVESRSTAFLNEISLFREAPPTLFGQTGASARPAFSPGARYAAVVSTTASGSELTIVDLKTGTDFLPYRSTSAAAGFRLSWSRDGDRLLISRAGTNPSFLLWSVADTEKVIELKQETGLDLEDAFWAQDAARLYGAAQGQLYEIAPDTLVTVAEGPAVAEPLVAGATLYGIEDGSTAKLVRRKLKESAFEPLAELPSPAFHPLAGDDGRVAYAADAGDDLFVIDPSGDRPKAFETRGKDGVWSSDGSRLLYWSDLELRVYDVRSGNDDLITRLGGPITQAAWHHPEWNALYAVNGGLYAVEASDHFGRLTVPLAEFSAIEGFAVSSAGDFAYVFGTKDGQTGLWRLRLR